MKRAFVAALLVTSACGTLLGAGGDEEASPVTIAEAGADATPDGGDLTASGEGGAVVVDPCPAGGPPSFCEGFDDEALSTEWTKSEANGGVVSIIPDGEEGRALRGSGPATGSNVSFANVTRKIPGAVSGVDCTFRARSDAASWRGTFDIFVIESNATPAYVSFFTTVWSWTNDIGASIISLLADGGSDQRYPRGDGGIAAPDGQWLDVHVALSSADGWILHGSIGAATIDVPLVSPGDALVDPTLHFGLHWGQVFDDSPTIHLDVDRIVCRITRPPSP